MPKTPSKKSVLLLELRIAKRTIRLGEGSRDEKAGRIADLEEEFARLIAAEPADDAERHVTPPISDDAYWGRVSGPLLDFLSVEARTWLELELFAPILDLGPMRLRNALGWLEERGRAVAVFGEDGVRWRACSG